MAISPLGPTSIPSISPAAGAAIGASPQRTADVPFSQVMQNLLQQVNSQQVQADASVKDLVAGKTDNVHDVVLSVAKADMSFRLMLEIRNRVMDAYQEIMRMQV